MKASMLSLAVSVVLLLPASLATPVPDSNIQPRADACIWSSRCDTTIPNAVGYCNRWSRTCAITCKSGFQFNTNKDGCVARARQCKLTSDCAGITLPANANAYCNQPTSSCTFRCRKNFVASSDGASCDAAQASITSSTLQAVVQAAVQTTQAAAPTTSAAASTTAAAAFTTQAAATTTEAAVQSPVSSAVASPSSVVTAAQTESTSVIPFTYVPALPVNDSRVVNVSMVGLTAFGANETDAQGRGAWNNNTIASWFRTNNPADDTVGASWCFSKYKDDWRGFAPSVSSMLRNFPLDTSAWNVEPREAYCGLEAEVVTSDGRSTLLYIVDGFDDAWVKMPGAIDVVVGVFPELWGSVTSNKNHVAAVSWRLTGRRSVDYQFRGSGPDSSS